MTGGVSSSAKSEATSRPLPTAAAGWEEAGGDFSAAVFASEAVGALLGAVAALPLVAVCGSAFALLLAAVGAVPLVAACSSALVLLLATGGAVPLAAVCGSVLALFESLSCLLRPAASAAGLQET